MHVDHGRPVSMAANAIASRRRPSGPEAVVSPPEAPSNVSGPMSSRCRRGVACARRVGDAVNETVRARDLAEQLGLCLIEFLRRQHPCVAKLSELQQLVGNVE